MKIVIRSMTELHWATIWEHRLDGGLGWHGTRCYTSRAVAEAHSRAIAKARNPSAKVEVEHVSLAGV